MHDFMKTIISALQTWTSGKIKDSTADWNQNDSSADSYVKNRTHWEEIKDIVVLKDFLASDGPNELNMTHVFEVGARYKVICDGVVYDNLVAEIWGDEFNGVGGIWEDYTKYPFGFCSQSGGDFQDKGTNMVVFSEGVHKLTLIQKDAKIFHTLDPKYLPGEYATVSEVKAVQDLANGRIDEVQFIANKAQTTANSVQTTKMDKENPVGTGSFSMNRTEGSVVGDYSSTHGYETAAGGRSRFVCGEYNANTTVYTDLYDDFINGYTLYSKTGNFYYSTEYSFDVETGIYTLISPTLINASELTASKFLGTYFVGDGVSLAENTTSGTRLISGVKDHYLSNSTASYVSTEIRNHNNHKYRIFYYCKHESKPCSTERGIYVHIVGNGTSDTERSNAHTLDWNGVGWFQGGLQVGGNAQDDGAKNVLLEGDAIPVPETAEVGQVMRVSEVDENGKPIAWEATDIQSNWSQNDPTASDYIQNRICYETQEIGSAVYTFDGDMTNHETVLYDGVYLVKISDDVLYAPEIVSGSFTTSLNGSGVLDKDMFEDMASQGLPVYTLKEIPVIVIVYQDFEFNGTTVSSGVWVMCEPEVPFWVSRFEYNGAINKPKKINKRYIPSEVAAVPVAQVGQTVAVSEIDENGKPIAWEAVDINKKINLSDYGFDAFALFAQGGGTATISNVRDLFDSIGGWDSNPVTVIIENESAGIRVEGVAIKTGTPSSINGLTINAPIYYVDANKYYMLTMYINSTLSDNVKLIVNEIDKVDSYTKAYVDAAIETAINTAFANIARAEGVSF